MSFLCPVCNGFQNANIQCSTCKSQMNDSGRYMDQFDDYSPYLDIDGMKKLDGIENDLENHTCPHVFDCPSCGNRQLEMVREWNTF